MTDTTGDLARELLADLLDDAARVLRRGPHADAQALALHLTELDGPHRAAWLKLAPLTCRQVDRTAARAYCDTATRPGANLSAPTSVTGR